MIVVPSKIAFCTSKALTDVIFCGVLRPYARLPGLVQIRASNACVNLVRYAGG
jgi:hypothetical protein